MADGLLLSEADYAVLKRIVGDVTARQGNTPNRPFVPEPLGNSPDVYVALTPTGGIPALTQGSGCTLNITMVSGGAVTAVTIQTGGTGYLASSVIVLDLAGGGGGNGKVMVTTNATGVVSTVNSIAAGGTGYVVTSAVPTIVDPSYLQAAPGVGQCLVFRKIGTGKLVPVDGLNKFVSNLSLSDIPGSIWVLVERDKYGDWYIPENGKTFNPCTPCLGTKAFQVECGPDGNLYFVTLVDGVVTDVAVTSGSGSGSCCPSGSGSGSGGGSALCGNGDLCLLILAYIGGGDGVSLDCLGLANLGIGIGGSGGSGTPIPPNFCLRFVGSTGPCASWAEWLYSDGTISITASCCNGVFSYSFDYNGVSLISGFGVAGSMSQLQLYNSSIILQGVLFGLLFTGAVGTGCCSGSGSGSGTPPPTPCCPGYGTVGSNIQLTVTDAGGCPVLSCGIGIFTLPYTFTLPWDPVDGSYNIGGRATGIDIVCDPGTGDVTGAICGSGFSGGSAVSCGPFTWTNNGVTPGGCHGGNVNVVAVGSF